MTSPQAQDDWTPCPPGELGRLTETMWSRRTRQRRIRAAGVVVGVCCVLLLTFTGVNWLKGTGGDMNFGGITCTEVRQQAADYMAGHVEETTASRIRIHLAECPLCQEYMKDMGMLPGGDAAAIFSRTSAHLAGAENIHDVAASSHPQPETAPRRLLADTR